MYFPPVAFMLYFFIFNLLLLLLLLLLLFVSNWLFCWDSKKVKVKVNLEQARNAQSGSNV